MREGEGGTAIEEKAADMARDVKADEREKDMKVKDEEIEMATEISAFSEVTGEVKDGEIETWTN